eukprot:3939931-Pyramimonas_sp.AAC.1
MRIWGPPRSEYVLTAVQNPPVGGQARPDAGALSWLPTFVRVLPHGHSICAAAPAPWDPSCRVSPNCPRTSSP